jgi:hypothetical protein
MLKVKAGELKVEEKKSAEHPKLMNENYAEGDKDV